MRKIVLCVMLIALSSCALLDKVSDKVDAWKEFYQVQRSSYVVMRDAYIIAKAEVIKQWDKFPPESQLALKRIDEVMVSTDSKLRELDEKLSAGYEDYKKIASQMNLALDAAKAGLEIIAKSR